MKKMKYFPLLYNRGFMRNCMRDTFLVLPFMCLTGKQLIEMQENKIFSDKQYFLFQKDNTVEMELLLPEVFSDRVFDKYMKYIVTPCKWDAKIKWERFDLTEIQNSEKHTELDFKLSRFGLQNGYIQTGIIAFLQDSENQYFLNICA